MEEQPKSQVLDGVDEEMPEPDDAFVDPLTRIETILARMDTRLGRIEGWLSGQ